MPEELQTCLKGGSSCCAPRGVEMRSGCCLHIPSVLLLFALCSAGLVLGCYFYLHSMDTQAAKDLAARVKIAVNVEIDRQETLLEDYTYWDEGYRKTIVDPDPEWIEDNTGEYLRERFGYRFTLAAKNGVKATYISVDEDGPQISYAGLMRRGLGNLLEKARGLKTITRVVSGFMVLEDGVYLVSLGLFIDEKAEQVRPDHSCMLFARRLDDKFIGIISETYKLPGLRFLSGSTDRSGLILESLSGRPSGELIWDTPQPSRTVLPELLIVAAGLFFLTVSLTAYILFRDNRYRRCYEKELREARDMAESACRVKSDFMTAMGHDLSSPINGVMGMLQLLRMEMLTSEQQSMIGKALTSCRRIEKMLVDFSHLSKSDVGGAGLERLDFDLHESLENLCAMFEPVAERKMMIISCDTGWDVPRKLYGDEQKLVRLLSSLVENSIRFADSGMVHVSVCPVQRKGNKVRLLFTVSDKGPGISEDEIAGLFDGSGTAAQNRGVGLSVVRWFARLMDGSICVDSAPGEGTTFAVVLPFVVRSDS
ncbi:sensor histidine kinase [Maridesulfovibrio sp. FT414]|uniref:sensor histidine kinase n=1 Tax=Maridesulfovibrio sp. FT414 TaxID=2979469 RepID=UPI003D802A8B